MRNLIVLFIFVSGPLLSLYTPVYGVMVYALISYLNPHRLAWGSVATLPIAKTVAIATLLSFLVHNGDKKLPVNTEVCLILLFWFLAAFGWFFAFNPSGYMEEIQRFTKIILMVILTVCLIKSKENLRLLVLIIILSIGFYILKGAIWGLRGGVGWVRGPSGTFFGANNEMGLVANMVWPFFLFIANTEKNKWVKRTLWCIFFITPLTIVLTKSRGAALAMAITGVVLFTRVKRKIMFILAGIIALIMFIPFVPSGWYERMETIETYKEDGSAMGRINAWHAAWNMALDNPLTGGGLRAFTPETIWRYAPDPEDFHDVHSIYFEVLGEMGFPGLIVFILIIITTLTRLKKIRKLSKQLTDREFYLNYSNSITLGIFAYMINGAFLGLAYFDLFYQYIGLSIALGLVMDKDIKSSILKPQKAD